MLESQGNNFLITGIRYAHLDTTSCFLNGMKDEVTAERATRQAATRSIVQLNYLAE